jgi:hypothetical protein
MPSITMNLTETEMKCLEFATVSPQEWGDNAIKNRARVAKDEIIATLVAHCNENSVAIATGEDAQVTQAYDLGVVQTAAQVNANIEAEQAAMSGGSE